MEGNKRKWIIILSIIGVVVVGEIAAIFFVILNRNSGPDIEEMLVQAEAYFDEKEYEEAIEEYKEILEFDEESEKAYLGLADVYMETEDYKKAQKLLEDAKVESKKITKKLDKVMEALDEESEDESDQEPEQQKTETKVEVKQVETVAEVKEPEYYLESVSTSMFPIITLDISSTDAMQLTEDDITILENGSNAEIVKLNVSNETMMLGYLSPDIYGDGNKRTVEISVLGKSVTVDNAADKEYASPAMQPANITFVSSDVSAYPEISLYVRVDNGMETIKGLNTQNFIIKERLEGGEFLYQEVQTAEILDQNAALNISLVADKSGSIDISDMDKIKTVMKEFINILQYNAGDKAEVLAIDDIVRQMCTFTSNNVLLQNGIDNMFPEGMTAFYDGIMEGVTHTMYEDGARCVIAFTDGIDNSSYYTPDEVINFANSCKVPVYIIGVGGNIDSSELERIAYNTGGQYWYIDDLYSLEEIYQSIYREQKEMYRIVYHCDERISKESIRDINISMVGQNYCAENEVSVEPAELELADNTAHSSRYELVMSDASWEAARKACSDMGGHLVTITSQSEMDTVIQMAEDAGVDYIWLGGYTSYDRNDNVFAHWVTGEEFNYYNWSKNEPSRKDLDGTNEWYLMLWNLPQYGGWTWNDQRNDPAADLSYFRGKMAFICEYE